MAQHHQPLNANYESYCRLAPLVLIGPARPPHLLALLAHTRHHAGPRPNHKIRKPRYTIDTETLVSLGCRVLPDSLHPSFHFPSRTFTEPRTSSFPLSTYNRTFHKPEQLRPPPALFFRTERKQKHRTRWVRPCQSRLSKRYAFLFLLCSGLFSAQVCPLISAGRLRLLEFDLEERRAVIHTKFTRHVDFIPLRAFAPARWRCVYNIFQGPVFNILICIH